VQNFDPQKLHDAKDASCIRFLVAEGPLITVLAEQEVEIFFFFVLCFLFVHRSGLSLCLTPLHSTYAFNVGEFSRLFLLAFFFFFFFYV
jgi:hypothetical protein